MRAANANSVVYEGQDAVFQIYTIDEQALPAGTSIAGEWRLDTVGGFSAADLRSGQAMQGQFTILPGQRQTEVRMHVVQDSIVETGERMTFVLASVFAIPADGNMQVLGVDSSITIYVDDTFGASITGPVSQIAEGGSAVYTVTIANGLANHTHLILNMQIPDSNGMRRADIMPPVIRHSGVQATARRWVGAEGGYRSTVPARIDGGTAGFTITVTTVDDNEPENLEELCVQLRALVPSGSNPYRLFINPSQSRACTHVADNDGSLHAALGAPSAATVDEGVQVTIPVTFTATAAPGFTASQMHPRVFTYLHYTLSGSATAGADYSVGAAANSDFNNADRRGYLRIAPGIPNGNAGASPHRITINIAGDTAAEEAETITATLNRHNHNANRNDNNQFRRFRNPALSQDSATTRSVTIVKNAPVVVSVSAQVSGVAEGQSAIFQVCARPAAGLSRAQNIRIAYRIGGNRYLTTADYTNPGGTLDIAVGGIHCPVRTITVPIVADGNHFELEETLTLTLTGASGGGSGGAVVSYAEGSADVTIRQSSTIVHIGAPVECLRKTPASPDCVATPRPADLTIEGGDWRVPVDIIPGADVGAMIIRYTVAAAAGTTGFAAADFNDSNNGMLRFSADTVRGRNSNNVIAIRMRDDDSMEADEAATLTITSVAWEDAGETAPLALAGDFKTASTVVADDEVTVRVASCRVESGNPRCGGGGAMAAEGSQAGALFEFAFYDASGTRVSQSPAGTVTYRISGDVTVADYSDSAAGVFTSNPTDTGSRTHSIAITDDSLAENDETLTLTITSVTGGIANIDADNDSASVTIPANDGIRVFPRLVHAPAQSEPDSGGVTVNFEFCTAGEAVTGTTLDDVSLLVNYAFGGTAIGAHASAANSLADYHRDNPSFREIQMLRIRRIGHGCIELPDNSTEQDITILADDRNEPAETISIAITRVTETGAGNRVNAQVDTDPVTYTIAASDPLTVTVTACPASGACTGDAATEYLEGRSARFLVSYNGNTVPGAALTLNYRISGDVDSADYTDSNAGTFTIAAETTTTAQRTLSIGIVDDSDAENPEDFVVDFTSVTSAAGGGAITFTPAQFSATIPANDGILGSVTTQSTVAEGQAAVFSFSLVGQVNAGNGMHSETYTTSGTWEGAAADNAGEPFSISLNCAPITAENPDNDIGDDGICRVRWSINIAADGIVEADETLTVTLGNRASATTTVTDATPLTVAVADADEEAEEGGNAEFALSFNLDEGVTLAADVTVNYTFAGDAVTDGSGSVTVASGASSGTLSIAVPDDNLNEAASTLTVTLGDITGATVAAAGGTAEATVAASNPIAVTIARQGAADVDEDATVTFRVSLSGGLRTADVVVPFTFGGSLDNAEYAITAPAGIAATATGGTVTFDTSGTPTATGHTDITVNLQGDTLNEAADTLTITGAAPGDSGLRTAGAIDYTSNGNTDSVNITDDDAITVTVAPAESSVGEGDEAEFTVTLSTTSAAAATVNFAAAIVAQTMTANA
ncbi:MAG: hypothetical protein OXU94_03215, partial [Gammaproteobacteria bacterium]|nr:hypothetical protein [Gammaproteobacteria bacterium]